MLRHNWGWLAFFLLLNMGCHKNGFSIRGGSADEEVTAASVIADNSGNAGGGDTTPAPTGNTGQNMIPLTALGYSSDFSLNGLVALPTNYMDCMTNPNADFCTFRDGPVYQTGAAFNPRVTVAQDLSAYQTWGFKITDLDNSGFLSNKDLVVLLNNQSLTNYINNTADPSRTKLRNGSWKYSYSSADVSNFLQVHNYAYLTALRQFFTKKAGFFPTSNSGTAPVLLARFENAPNNAYYRPDLEVIVLGSSTYTAGAYPLGTDADVAMHEYGHAILNFSAANRDQIGDNLTVDCGTVTAGATGACCSTTNGCVGGIHEGQADFFIALLSPFDTRMAMSWMNNTSGLRNSSAYANMTKANSGQEVHDAGRLYSSIWYEIYKANKFSDDIIRLFAEHQKVLTGADSFLTAKAKIKAVDQNLFQGKYSSGIEVEFNRRGL